MMLIVDPFVYKFSVRICKDRFNSIDNYYMCKNDKLTVIVNETESCYTWIDLSI